MQDYTPEQLQPILKELEQAIYSHELWHKDLLRTMLCQLPVDQRELAPDAHRLCRFGQWYYGTETQGLRESDGFKAMEQEHEHLHRAARRVLESIEENRRVDPTDFDELANVRDRLILELRTLKLQIEDAVYKRDALTGAWTRTQMLPTLHDLFAMAKREVLDCTLAMMDIDHFKRVNDLHGHPAGDRVLANVVQQIRQLLRQYDKVFRYGGEEFLIVMPDSDMETAFKTVERIRTQLEDRTIACAGDTPIVISASFGLARLVDGVELSIQRADIALYAAKQRGRNCTVTWSEQLAPRG